MKKNGLIALFIFIAGFIKASDITVGALNIPVTGCVLTTAETVQAVVHNYIPGPDITVSIGISYVVNGGAPVTETMSFTPIVPFTTNSNFTYTFTQKADLSAPGTYSISVYVTYTVDANHVNDTLKALVNSDPLSVGGSIAANTTVCSGANAGSLTLSGYTGSVTNWESSTNGGASWSNIANTTASQVYSNILSTTVYRAIVTSGVCTFSISGTATVATTSVSVGGTIASNTTVCIGTNSGTLTLSGYTGNILDWESTTNGVWNPIANITITQPYNNLIATTLYRSSVKSGVCPAAYSSTVTITTSPLTIAGTVAANATVCSGANSGALTLSGYTGSILNWETSTNGGGTWVPISPWNTTPTQNYLNLNTDTWYHAVVQSGACSSAISSVAILTINPIIAVGGTISSSTSVCSGVNSGTLTLSGYSGTISKWESSTDNGTNWIPIANTTPSESYANLMVATWYRVQVQNGICPSAISSVAIVAPPSVGGIVLSNTTVCNGVNAGTLTLAGFLGNILNWESSTDSGTSWTPVSNTTVSLSYTNLTTETWYRAMVKSGICPTATSSTAMINFFPKIVDAGNDATIALGDSINLNGSGGSSYLWMPSSNVNYSTVANPGTRILVTTTYTLLVTDTHGCSDTDYVKITVKHGDFSYLISNLITLNGDGINDTWYIQFIEQFPTSAVSIYNINGQEIFRASPYMNDWEGTYKGGKVPDGSYFYVLKFTDNEIIKKGSITIVSEKK